MIYTVTFNPAIDYVLHLSEVRRGEVNRADGEEIYFGGKGINVSTVLKNLGCDSVALGFIAGFTGTAIENGLRESGVETDFIRLKNGTTRINVKIKADTETDINGCGPGIDEGSAEELLNRLDMLKENDYLVLAGSIPLTMPGDTYERIMERLSGRGINIVVDATRELLLNVLKYRPFLVKPNNHELEEMLGETFDDIDGVIGGARRLREMGARNVLVSMAGDGAVLVTEQDEVLRMGVPKGKVKNSVGAGDSMVAGFICGYLRYGSYKEALKLGTACGSATAFSPGLAERELIEELLKTL